MLGSPAPVGANGGHMRHMRAGVMCVALNKKAAGAAARLFEKRLVSKLYLALVDGHVPWAHASCDEAVGEDAADPRGFRMALESQPSCTSPRTAHTDLYTVACGYLGERAVTKLLLHPSSGRRHQLRLHCLGLGFPIVGDVAYSGDTQAERMMLHAWRLCMPLPRPFASAPLYATTADPFVLTNAGGRGPGAASGEGGRHERPVECSAPPESAANHTAIAVSEKLDLDVDAILEELRPQDGDDARICFHVCAPQSGSDALPLATGNDPKNSGAAQVGSDAPCASTHQLDGSGACATLTDGIEQPHLRTPASVAMLPAGLLIVTAIAATLATATATIVIASVATRLWRRR